MALAAFACLAQLGTSLYLASARLLITQVVAKEDRREAIAWQRTANNLAQIISFSLGALLSGFGTTLLILFDAVTSFIAAGVGARILPNPRPNLSANPSASLGASSIPNPSANLGTNPPLTEIAQPPASPDLDTMAQPLGDSTKTKSRRDFYHCALVIASFSFLYDLYEVGGAARCKIIFGQEGLAVFSEVMVINTALCAALSVVAAKKMQNAANALPIGMFLLIAGLVITFMGNQGRAVFFAGSFVMTAGEITFNSLAAVVLIHLTPQSKRQGATYSTGVFVQSLGRILGSALAFPMLIGSDHALAYVFVASIPTLGICLSARPLLKRLEAW
jgi:predicted membrane channel-forming protein YqfA (hemolysin III family)